MWHPPISTVAGAVVAAAVIFLWGVLAGRSSVSTKTLEKKKEITQTVEAKQSEVKSESGSALALATGRDEKVHVRLVWRPDGTRYLDVHRSDVSSSVVAAAQKETKHEIEVRYQERIVEKETLKIVEAARPQWSLEARTGATLDARLTYGGALSRRIAGPFWAGAWLEAGATKAAGVMVRVEW